jgi:curved DNA-binding protein CbpA
MGAIKTHYDNLQVARNASPEVIRAAYKGLTQRYHPDRNPNDRERCERVMKIINRAFEVLSDPQRRAEHDAWIAEQETATRAESVVGTNTQAKAETNKKSASAQPTQTDNASVNNAASYAAAADAPRTKVTMNAGTQAQASTDRVPNSPVPPPLFTTSATTPRSTSPGGKSTKQQTRGGIRMSSKKGELEIGASGCLLAAIQLFRLTSSTPPDYKDSLYTWVHTLPSWAQALIHAGAWSAVVLGVVLAITAQRASRK